MYFHIFSLIGTLHENKLILIVVKFMFHLQWRITADIFLVILCQGLFRDVLNRIIKKS